MTTSDIVATLMKMPMTELASAAKTALRPLGRLAEAGTGIESQTISASHVVLSGEAYFIQVSVATANHRVHGAVVTYNDP